MLFWLAQQRSISMHTWPYSLHENEQSAFTGPAGMLRLAVIS